MHTAAPLMPGPIALRAKIVTAKVKMCILPGSDRILAELVQVAGETLQSESLEIINSIWNT
jgi:hypothetical protein